MYRRNRRHKKFSNLALAILCIVAIITLGTLLYINDKQEKEQQIKYEQIAREEREKQKKIEDQSNITLTQDNIAFLDDSEAEEVVSTERMLVMRLIRKSYPLMTEWIWKQGFHRTVSIYSFVVDITVLRLLIFRTLIDR